MAVEKGLVLIAINKKFEGKSLSKTFKESLAEKWAAKIDEETGIDDYINDREDVVLEAEKEANSRVTDAVKKATEKKTPEKTEVKVTDDVKVSDDAPEWAKALLKSNEKLTSDLEAIKSGNILDTKKQTALQSFEKSEVLKGLKPELKDRWVARIDVNSETPIEDQIKELETEYSELVQVNADSNVFSGGAGMGLPKGDPTLEDIKKIYE